MFWGGVFVQQNPKIITGTALLIYGSWYHIYVISILLLLMMFAKGLIQIVSACLEFNSTRYGSIIESGTGR